MRRSAGNWTPTLDTVALGFSRILARYRRNIPLRAGAGLSRQPAGIEDFLFRDLQFEHSVSLDDFGVPQMHQHFRHHQGFATRAEEI